MHGQSLPRVEDSRQPSNPHPSHPDNACEPHEIYLGRNPTSVVEFLELGCTQRISQCRAYLDLLRLKESLMVFVAMIIKVTDKLTCICIPARRLSSIPLTSSLLRCNWIIPGGRYVVDVTAARGRKVNRKKGDHSIGRIDNYPPMKAAVEQGFVPNPINASRGELGHRSFRQAVQFSPGDTMTPRDCPQ